MPKNDWKGLKSGKNVKKAIAFFSGKCHNSDILGKKYASLVNLYLDRRFMWGFYSAFGPKVKRFGCRRNAWFFKKNL